MAPPTAAPAQPPGARLGARLEAAIVAGAVLVFAGVGAFKAARLPYPIFDDVAYLDLGNSIRAAGGPLRLVPDLFAGRFTESNRHPIYLALLALFARPELGYHRDAQALAVALGALALLSCWWVARRHFGREAAAVLATFFAGSGALAWTASHECADALLIAFWAQAVGAILDGGLDGGEAQGAKQRRAWLVAGVWSGLAYLTKGPGLFLPLCLGLTLLARERLRAVRDAGAWLFAAAFALVSSPLWVRNLRVYGSPTYSLNGKYLWIDRLPDFAEVFAPGGEARLPHTAREYFAQATFGSVAWRVGMGVAESIFHLGDALALVAPRPGSVLHVIWVVLGVIAAGVALRCTWRWRPGFQRTFMLVHAAWWCAFLVFFNAAGGASRYFLPLVATTLAPALAAGFVERAGPARLPRWMAGFAGVVAFAVAGALALDAGATRPPPGFLEVQAWLVQHVGEGEGYAVDARTHLQPRWLLPRGRQLIVSASWQNKPVPTDEMLRYLCEARVRYVVIDAESETSGVEAGDTRARYFFYDRLPRQRDGAVPDAGFPAGLRLVYQGAEAPRRWTVLELTGLAGKPCAP